MCRPPNIFGLDDGLAFALFFLNTTFPQRLSHGMRRTQEAAASKKLSTLTIPCYSPWMIRQFHHFMQEQEGKSNGELCRGFSWATPSQGVSRDPGSPSDPFFQLAAGA